MARAILLLAFLALFKSAQTGSKEYFQLRCPFRTSAIYWIRSPNLVLETYWFYEPVYTPKGNDLMNRTDVFNWPLRLHKIKVKIDQDIDAYWRCCILTFFNDVECTKWVFVKGASTVTETASMETPKMPSFTPAVPSEEFNGTLSLTISPETPAEGQNVTFSCTIDTEIDQDKWIVFWFQNKTLTFITDTNSSIVKSENLTDTLNQFVNDSTISDETRHTFDDVFQYAFVSSNAFQHNWTIPVSSSLIGNTSWNCGNSYLSNSSNTLIIQVFAESTTSFTTQDSEELSTPTESDARTTLSSTSLDLKGKASTTTYIVTGSVSGIIVIVIALVVVMIVCRRRRDKEIDTTEASDKRKEESRIEDVVMEENVLYVGSKGNDHENIGYQDELVMEDNVLYVSGNGDEGRGNC